MSDILRGVAACRTCWPLTDTVTAPASQWTPIQHHNCRQKGERQQVTSPSSERERGRHTLGSQEQIHAVQSTPEGRKCWIVGDTLV